MNKILIKVSQNNITFSMYEKNIKSQNLNNTNVIDAKNLKFTEEYILDNMDLMNAFLNLVIVKYNISNAIIINNSIALTSLKLIQNLTNIYTIKFAEDKGLDYDICVGLLKNENLKRINCYNMPQIMFARFKKNVVETRSEMLFPSDFMSYNDINTYSKLCNKDKIIIDGKLDEEDLKDLTYFFKNNKRLNKIEIKNYDRNIIIEVVNKLKDYVIKDVSIIILEDQKSNKKIINDIPYLNSLSKKCHAVIKIKYSSSYKKKNAFKQTSFVIIRLVVVAFSLVALVILVHNKYTEIKSKQNLKEDIKTIKNVNKETIKNNAVTTTTVASSNDPETEEKYNQLLAVNGDTVGWLKVNGTSIDYPVVQSSDNNYYLKHSFDKTYNINGWIFVDYRDNMDTISKNTIMYGHNMDSGTVMFTTLNKVLDASWYTNSDNLQIEFDVKGRKMKWQVFSIYTIDVTSDYLITDFSSNTSFQNYVKREKERSIYNFGVGVSSDDKILTLSTCYVDSSKRLVVHAKKL